MAHNIDQTTKATGSAVYANTPAWHGLGVTLDHAPTAEEAIEQAGLGWSVEKRPLLFSGADGSPITIEGTFVTVRTDTETPFGVVSDDYEPLQNSEAFDALSIVLQEAGLAYESAGALNGGASIWLLARHPDRFEVAGDEVLRYVLLSTSHDGSGAVKIGETDVRVVCQNTLDLALSSKRGVWVSLRHSKGLAGRIRDARAAFARTNEAFGRFQTEAAQLAKTRVSKDQVDTVINATLDSIIGEIDGAAVLDAALQNPATTRLIAKRDAARDTITATLRRELKDAGTKLTNAWLLGNAIGEWIDTGSQRFLGEETERAEKRFGSVLYGPAAERRAEVWQTILETVTVNV